jgi:hypothetical protein
MSQKAPYDVASSIYQALGGGGGGDDTRGYARGGRAIAGAAPSSSPDGPRVHGGRRAVVRDCSWQGCY